MYITNVRLRYARRSGNQENPGTLIRRLKVLNPKFSDAVVGNRSVCLGCRDPVRVAQKRKRRVHDARSSDPCPRSPLRKEASSKSVPRVRTRRADNFTR
ncbi:hypothetical protein ALC56_03424 [Trachymyrmex septentrionalis]|uniref:Uncharacterized protein n=1 Tax=Trachymyrmex septentrionalis TaxID=34720 RepID=A0A195FPG3_9HYME|nr:hypothetical protein ALC56_03424 [Trachymyrmex septentrionalis]